LIRQDSTVYLSGWIVDDSIDLTDSPGIELGGKLRPFKGNQLAKAGGGSSDRMARNASP
jgi:hypothetical protein